jgi:large subunit ribosomal protein L25
MRQSLQKLARRQRLLASEVLAKAEKLKGLQKEGSGDPFFAQLPRPLATFLQKFPPAPFRTYSEKPTSTHAEDANPFLANKHPVTNKWHSPKYSLRRQSDLYKMAYRFGITHLLPKLANDKKFYEEKYLTKVPPIGSLRFKLTKGERIAPLRQQEVDQALANADDTIAKAKGTKYRRKLDKKSERGLGFI